MKSLISCTVCPNSASSSQRFMRRVSAPNISGTSVRMVVPPLLMSRSEKPPTVGFAVMPDRPSEPPHFMPITSSLQEMGSRFAFPAYSARERRRQTPSSISSSQSWAFRKRMRSGSYSPI